jgi:hypothetical protein
MFLYKILLWSVTVICSVTSPPSKTGGGEHIHTASTAMAGPICILSADVTNLMCIRSSDRDCIIQECIRDDSDTSSTTSTTDETALIISHRLDRAEKLLLLLMLATVIVGIGIIITSVV